VQNGDAHPIMPAHMRAWIIVRMLALLLAGSACFASEDPAAEQLATSVTKLVDIRSPDSKPFQMDASFRAQVNSPQDGHLTWKWAAKDLWTKQITLGSYREFEVRKGNVLYISRNLPFTPERVAELMDLLTIFSADTDHWKIKKAKHEVRDGIELNCLQIAALATRGEWNPKREVCINQGTQEVLTDDAKDGAEDRKKSFADYQAFRDHIYPRQLKLLVNGSEALNVHVASLQEATFGNEIFVPLPGAVVRRQCEHMIRPVAVKDPNPPYPQSSAQDRRAGTAIVALTVLPDGSVDNVQLIGSAGHEMDQVSEEIVKTWKFKPAMCGNEPIAYDLRVEINFGVN
jgi:TonB family protein